MQRSPTNPPKAAPRLQRFPKNFTWGAASAAYQIEGAWNLDGRSPSIWDVFSHQSSNVFENHNGDVACDHYHHWRRDVEIMRDLGLHAYRLSVSWPRVQLNGSGGPNAKGLAFYDKLIDALLATGITPWVTLYHWDLPHALQQRGGFLNRDIVEWFGDYAAMVAERLGDRVKHWITFNEPQVIMGHGHQMGEFAPGLKLPYAECLRGAHHLLLAHGRGVQALRANCRGPIKISLAQTSTVPVPASDTPEDIEAARRAFFGCSELTMWNLAWWADPIVLGHYPDEGLKAFGGDVPQFTSEDLKVISQPIDFLAYNCYTGYPVQADPDGNAKRVPGGWGTGNPRGTLPWLQIAPLALYWGARFQTERYKLPMVFSENGFCNTDFVHLDGKVHDPQRIDFMQSYLQGIARAIGEGIPVEGYFYWSILDNFEWKEGYKDRFGLVHVDYQTQQRTPKDSFNWYRDVIRTNGANLHSHSL